MKILAFIKKNDPLLRRLSLTLFVFAVATGLFFTIAKSVVNGSVLAYDEQFLLALNERASPTLDAFFTFVTDLGGVLAVTIVTVGLLAYFLRKKLYYKTLLVATGVGGAALLNVIAKASFARERPDLWGQLISESSFSFPSGHAMGSSALAFTLIALLWKTRCRILALVVGAVYIFMIGFSRLYLGVHYPTDVLAGWTLSLAWVATVATIIYTRRQYVASKSTPTHMSAKADI
ncbi:MAG: phosphoesterase PA-phosphatase-like protein [Candidatus Saccharibacteria bacterium GW2011_GWC2_48_9]|nr:MAG: phosphoesterase PA-phosphatase-like protein [Candidatus Saccharibacteria bacterium GW2011_GWC2_48_9]HCH34350.1 hypothetical protein [Candidatus Saccharibacteria bacterium]